jgi:N-acyl-D-amino-acid deacylase
MHDILIINGTIIDGNNTKRYCADIAINDGKITEIGELSGDSARETIDASELIVAPGFIDISNRSDTRWKIFKDPHLESMLHQGVTTIIGGNSGASLAPIYNEEMFNSVRKWSSIAGTNINWHSVDEFFEVLEKQKISVNFGMFVGYGTLRRGLLGDENRELTEEEKKSIKKHIQQSISEGALGVSTGLIYSHERNISTEELKFLAKIVEKNKGLYVAHLRNEGNEIIDSVKEVIEIHKDTGVKLHISHLKINNKNQWAKMDEVLQMIESTDVLFDIYPYTFSTTVLYTLLPDWVSDGGKRMMLERLKNKKLRQQVILELNKRESELSQAIVSYTPRSDYFCGKSFMEIAHSQETTVANAIVDVLLASEGQVNVFLESNSTENIVKELKSKNAVISSNGIGYSVKKQNSCMEHPRSFGAFARVISEYVNKRGILSIEEAIYKCTNKVAQELNIKDRGIIKEDKVADIVIFDEKNLIDHSTLEQPYKYATGVQTLIVCGQVAIKYGKYTGIRAGQIIRKK